MKISYSFNLWGFKREDRGEDGAVFVRYEEQKDTRKAEINASIYGGMRDTVNYTISIPKPKEKILTGCAIVTRSNANKYQATVFDQTRICSFNATALGELLRLCERFFAAKYAGGKT